MNERDTDAIDVILTERQLRGIANLLEVGRRVGFCAVVGYEPAELLSEPEMADLELRLRRALGEKP